MKRFALGCLLYDPARFGVTRVGDMIDAMAGYNERENERFKAYAEILRMTTALLWNVQVSRKDKLAAKDLMPFPWEKKVMKPIVISEEEFQRGQKLFEDILNGNSNNKP